MPSFALAFVLTLSTLLPAALAQTEPMRPTEKPPTAKAPFVFEPGVVELRTVIERCGTYLQRNILVDDSELLGGGQKRARPAPGPAGGAPAAAPADGPTGPFVELQLPVVTDRDGCEEMLTSLLWTRGLALVPLDEPKAVYEVLSMSGQRAREIATRAVQRTPEQVLARPTLRQFVSVVCPLQHTNATIATNALRPFFANNGNQSAGQMNVGNVGNSTSVLLSGPQDQVANALRILQSADVPQPPEVRPEWLQRVDALAKQTEQLAQRLAAVEEKVGKGR